MRRVMIAAGLVAALLSACGGSDAAECGEIADQGIQLLQEFVDEVDAMDAAELAEAASDEAFLGDIEDRANVLDERADAAGCTEDEMAELLGERTDDLAADTEFGQVIVDLILDDAFFTNE